jgi:hypothetical protein
LARWAKFVEASARATGRKRGAQLLKLRGSMRERIRALIRAGGGPVRW